MTIIALSLMTPSNGIVIEEVAFTKSSNLYQGLFVYTTAQQSLYLQPIDP